MKKALILFFLIGMSSAWAQPPRHGHHNHHHGHWRHHGGVWNWMVPAIIGGVVVYEINKQHQTPVIIQQPHIEIQNCSPWTEIQHPDGTITRTRTCNQ